MSQENVEIVRRLYEHWARGDYAFSGPYDPEVEFSRNGAKGGGVEGRWRGFEKGWAGTVEYLRAFEDLRTEAERIIDLDDDRVLVLSRQIARGKLSGAPTEHELGDVLALREARSCASISTGTAPKPSKPPGCRSSGAARKVGTCSLRAGGILGGRCRRRTSRLLRRSCVAGSEPTFRGSNGLIQTSSTCCSGGADNAVHSGIKGMRQAWAEWLGAWDQFKAEAREFVDLGHDVLVLVEFGGRGKASGVPIETTSGGCLFSFRDGRVTRVRTFTDQDEALEAVGLSE